MNRKGNTEEQIISILWEDEAAYRWVRWRVGTAKRCGTPLQRARKAHSQRPYQKLQWQG